MYTAPHLRCRGCCFDCSGGSRIAAAASVLNTMKTAEITESHILAAMTEVDPACPLFMSG
jgi:predicted metal-binding protein